MLTTKDKKGFSFNIPIAITIIFLSFFILFRSALSQLIGGGDCLEMEFFDSKINTCKESSVSQTLQGEQQEISAFVKSLKATIDSLENANSSLKYQIMTLENKSSGDDGTAGVISMSANSILNDKQHALYEKYSNAGTKEDQNQ